MSAISYLTGVLQGLKKIVVGDHDQQRLSEASNQQAFSFVACPNPDHATREDGWMSRQVYYAGDGVFKCGSCGREFTREEVISEIHMDYQRRLQDLQVWYQQSVLDICRDSQTAFDELDANNEERVACNAGDESRDV